MHQMEYAAFTRLRRILSDGWALERLSLLSAFDPTATSLTRRVAGMSVVRAVWAQLQSSGRAATVVSPINIGG
jgi:hypothetical protein